MEDIRSTTECTKFFWWLRLSVLIKVTYSVRSIFNHYFTQENLPKKIFA